MNYNNRLNDICKLVDAELETIVDPVIDDLIQGYEPKDTPLPQKEYRELKKLQILEEFNTRNFINHFVHGFEHLVKILPNILTNEEWVQVKQEMHDAETKLLTPVTPDEENEQFNTFGKLLKISDSTLKHFYKVGNILYSDCEYTAASDIFKILVFLDPYIADFWIALGLSLQQDDKYTDALNAYATAILTGNQNPAPRLYSAECYLAIDQLEDAKIEFKEAMKIIDQQKSGKQWVLLIDQLHQILR